MKKDIIIVIMAVLAIAGSVYVATHRSNSIIGPNLVNAGTPPSLEEGFGIWEAQLNIIANPGGSTVTNLTIINGQDSDRVFEVSLQQPNLAKLPKGYEPFPEECYDWFTITGWNGTAVTTAPVVFIPAGEYYSVPIQINVPADTTYVNKKAELRVRVTWPDPFHIVNIAYESKWFITIEPA